MPTRLEASSSIIPICELVHTSMLNFILMYTRTTFISGLLNPPVGRLNGIVVSVWQATRSWLVSSVPYPHTSECMTSKEQNLTGEVIILDVMNQLAWDQAP